MKRNITNHYTARGRDEDSSRPSFVGAYIKPWYSLNVYRELAALPGYVWCSLLLPVAVPAVAAAFWRSRLWIAILSFGLGAAATSVAESYYEVFVAKRFDEKFRYAPDVAFELGVFAAGIIVSLSVLVFGLTLALSRNRKIGRRAMNMVLALAFGGFCTTLPWLLSRPDTPALDVWIWIVGAPILSAFLFARCARDSHK